MSKTFDKTAKNFNNKNFAHYCACAIAISGKANYQLSSRLADDQYSVPWHRGPLRDTRLSNGSVLLAGKVSTVPDLPLKNERR